MQKIQLSQIEKVIGKKLENREIVVYDQNKPIFIIRKPSNVEEREIKKRKYARLFFFLGGFIIFLSGIYFFYLVKVVGPIQPELERWAKLGDAFGVANTIFSSLALLGIIYTNYLQRKSVDYQKEEYKSARSEYEKSVVLNSKTILLSSYIQQLQWYAEESRLRSEGKKGTLSDQNYRLLREQARTANLNLWTIIDEIQNIIERNDEN